MLAEIAASILARVLFVAFGVVTSIITARYLGPTGRGEYFFVLTVLNLIVGLGVLGLPGTYTYLSAQHHSRVSELHASALWISLTMGMLGSSVAVALATTIPGQFQLSAISLSYLYFLAPLAIYGQLCTALLVGTGRIIASCWISIIQGCSIVLGVMAAALLGADVQGFLAATTLGNAIFAIAFAIYISGLARLTWRADGGVLRTGLGFGMRSFVISFAGLILLRAHAVLLGYYSGQIELGYFSIVSQIGDALILLPAAVSATLFPRLVGSVDNRWPTTRRMLWICGALNLTACVAAAICAPLIPYVFGKEFEPSVVILYWVLPAIYFYGMTSIASQYLTAFGIPRALIVLWILAGVFGLACSFWLIPMQGAIGAAKAMSLSCAGLCAAVIAMTVAHGRSDVTRQKSV